MPYAGIWIAALVTAVLCGTVQPSTAQTGNPENVVKLDVHRARAGFNRLFVSVTLCVPRTTRCATVDDVLVDTGSTGLRLEPSALPSDLQLPAFLGPDRRQVGECVRFLYDNAWGELFTADLHMGGMTAPDLPIQIIGSGHAPDTCPSSGAQPTANGTLGIGTHLTDCTGDCIQNDRLPNYFTCGSTVCAPLPDRVDLRYRLPNPLSRFPGHNNGVVFDLPAPPLGGAESVVGTLTFGVGSNGENTLGPARLLQLDRTGRFTTIYDGRSYPASYIDSGTETNIVPDDRLQRCPTMGWALCLTPARQLTATLIGHDGAALPVIFEVGDYADLTRRHVPASAEIAVAAPPPPGAFVWGAPFFFGKRVFLVMDGMPVPGSAGLRGPLYGWH